ncbi:unnamed protein product [Effrenium voratum]|nr:unnamed protein product [Effrenium voratum]
MKLHTVGFCGVDDSVDLRELMKLDQAFPGRWIEWGVLLRPDLQGTPRYASAETLRRLGRLARGEDPELPGRLRLAAHMCGQDCLRVLEGDLVRIKELHALLGFERMQLNPTKANEASGWVPEVAAAKLRQVAQALPELEFILQVNQETEELFQLLFHKEPAPPNLVALMDASCGLGQSPESWTLPEGVARFGFAGGLGPSSVLPQLEAMARACQAKQREVSVWIDMESKIRSKGPDGSDRFDLELVKAVAQQLAGSQWLRSNL